MAPPLDPIAPLRAALRGHYDIEREIGQGAFATVYLARDLKHERKVALKVLHADPTSETGELRFIREIRLLARLQHPNILPLHDSGHVDALLYYVMPYVSGETLRERIDREKQLPLDASCSIAREVADALAYAHAQGIIHRDIKPENILLSTGHPILADFGIARAIDVAGVRTLTRTGAASPGTPAYMSPEQLMGDKLVDGRSDTYSLGCVLFEMVTGKPPYAGKEGFVKRFTEAPPKASSLRKNLPQWLDEAIEGALQRDPQDRYPSAKGFAEALREPEHPKAAKEVDDGGRQAVSRDDVLTHFQPDDTVNRKRQLASNHARTAVAPEAGAGYSRNLFLDAVRSHPKTATGVLVGVLATATALAFTGGSSRLLASLGARVPVDSTRFVILPFTGQTPETRILASHISDGLYDALERDWDGLRIVDAAKVDELTRKNGGSVVTQSEALRLGRQLGAGQVVWGQVLAGSRIRATLYDVLAGASKKEISLDRAPQHGSEFAPVVRELLKVPGRPAAADAGDGGTRSFPAWQSYGQAHVELGRWDLPKAEARFSAAVESDPTFAAAQLWLAQVRELRSYNPVEAWNEHVARARAIPHSLRARDSILALALSSMAEGEYGNACNSYRQLVANDGRDYIAWYGLGLCGLADNALIPDPEQPDAWRFRSSFLGAAKAFDKATQLEPRLFTVLPFDTLLRVAPIQAAQLRPGVTSDKSKKLFLAYPSLVAETLAYKPFPLADVQSGRLRTAPKTAGLAAQQSRAFLLRVVLRWIREFPESAEAQEALGILQEAGGQIQSDRDGVPSALTAVLNAQKLSGNDEKRGALVAREVRLRLKRGEFGRARALSDSLLASVNASSTQSEQLAGLAALTGNLALTQRLLPPASIFVGLYDPQRPLPNDAIMSAAGALYVRAALGACFEDFDRMATQIDALLESYVPAAQQTALRDALTERSWSMATPCRPAFSLRVTVPVDRLLRMQQAFARSQVKVVRAEFDSLATLRESDRPGDVSPDVMYQEAWLLAAIGDTAAAIRRLDLSLSALPTWGTFILDHVPQSAGIVRAMMLRANLAQARGDVTTAQKWAGAASILWANADLSLQPDVGRMRSIVQQRALTAGHDPSSRR